MPYTHLDQKNGMIWQEYLTEHIELAWKMAFVHLYNLDLRNLRQMNILIIQLNLNLTKQKWSHNHGIA